MPTYRGSALSETVRLPSNVLICGANWIGDSIISMPAIQAYQNMHPVAKISLLVKKPLIDLWKMHRATHEIIELQEGLAGTWKTAQLIRQKKFHKAFVLPNSFRSALIPFLAMIPDRIGLPGHFRDWMLTDVFELSGTQSRHQAYEYISLMAPGKMNDPMEPPMIKPFADAVESAARIELLGDVVIGLMPGAARGPSKRWPAKHFSDLGQIFFEKFNASVVVLGSPEEEQLCASIAQDIGRCAHNLAGRLSLAEWVAVLKRCDFVVTNDSGGMHVASAVGTPVIALFGTTDPIKTGPLGPHCRVVQKSDRRNRDIKRNDTEAIKTLASITPQEVYQVALDLVSVEEG